MLTLRLGASNVYLLKVGADWVAIDAGPDYDGAWQEAVAQMASAAIAPRAVRQVLVTHGHPDHCGLAAHWQREAGAAVCVSNGDTAKLRGGGRDGAAVRTLALDFLQWNGVPATLIGSARERERRTPPSPGGETAALQDTPRLANLHSVAVEHGRWPGPLRATPAEPDGGIADGPLETLPGLRLLALHVPGHTPGSMLFFDDATGALYTGDHVLERIAPTPGIHFDAQGQRIRSLPLYLHSLAAVRDLRPRCVLPGHGEPFADLAGAVDRTGAVFRQRARRLLRHLQVGPASAWELVLRLFPHLQPTAAWVALAEVIGLLDLLEERGEVLPQPEDVLRFRLYHYA